LCRAQRRKRDSRASLLSVVISPIEKRVDFAVEPWAHDEKDRYTSVKVVVWDHNTRKKKVIGPGNVGREREKRNACVDAG